MDVAGGDDLTAHAPIPVLHFINFRENVGAESFALDRDQGLAAI